MLFLLETVWVTESFWEWFYTYTKKMGVKHTNFYFDNNYIKQNRIYERFAGETINKLEAIKGTQVRLLLNK